MKSKLNNWAIAIRVFWGIAAGLALLAGIIIASEVRDFLWFVYGAISAVAIFITSFAFASLLNGVAMQFPGNEVSAIPNAPTAHEDAAAPHEEPAPTPVDPKHPDY